MNGRRRQAAPVDHRPGVEALALVVGRTRSVDVGAQSDFRHRGELWQFRVPHPGHQRRHVAVRSGDQIVATATLLPGRGHQAAGRALEESPAKLGTHRRAVLGDLLVVLGDSLLLVRHHQRHEGQGRH